MDPATIITGLSLAFNLWQSIKNRNVKAVAETVIDAVELTDSVKAKETAKALCDVRKLNGGLDSILRRKGYIRASQAPWSKK